MATYGIPRYIRSDNGSEFIAQKIQTWLRENQIKTLYIDLGSPLQNGYIESFHSRFRDDCLNRKWLLNYAKHGSSSKIGGSIITRKDPIVGWDTSADKAF